METISLDKSIKISRRIINEDYEVPDSIEIIKEFGAMDRFKFSNSNIELPIEHIGLAVLSFNNASDQFTFKKLDVNSETGKMTETRVFESLVGTNLHVSDFLSSLAPNALNWYKNEQGTFIMHEWGKYIPPRDMKNYVNCKTYNSDGLDLREVAVQEAYSQALLNYVKQEVDEMKDPQSDLKTLEALDAFVKEDLSNFNKNFDVLKKQSQEYLEGSETSLSADNTSSNTQESFKCEVLDFPQ